MLWTFDVRPSPPGGVVVEAKAGELRVSAFLPEPDYPFREWSLLFDAGELSYDEREELYERIRALADRLYEQIGGWPSDFVASALLIIRELDPEAEFAAYYPPLERVEPWRLKLWLGDALANEKLGKAVLG